MTIIEIGFLPSGRLPRSLLAVQFLGIEIGHGATRVVALDVESASITATASAPHPPVQRASNGQLEFDPACWLLSVDVAMREVLEMLGGMHGRVASVSVTAEPGGMVVLDEADHIIRPTMLGGDTSAAPQGRRISLEFGGTPGVTEMLGNRIGPESMAAQLLWMKETEPQNFARIERVMSVEDFVGYWLTGNGGTSASSAAVSGLLAMPERAWCRPLLEFIAPELASALPVGLVPGSPRGTLRPKLAEAWGLGPDVLVAPGAGREAAAIYATGVGTPGDMVADLSSEASLVALSDGSKVDFRGEGSVGCDIAGNGFTRLGMRNVVAATELVRKHNGWPAEEFEQALSKSKPGAEGLLFLPYLKGETVPSYPDGAGVLHGMTTENFTHQNLARAAAEGVALGFGYALSRLSEIGFDPVEVRLTFDPGETSSQLLADVLGASVVAISKPGGPLLGSAMQAAAVWFREQGQDLGFEEIAGYVVAADEETRRTPDPERHEFYQELLGRREYLAETLHKEGFL